ncbi:MAG: hypothetical protein HOW73_39520 [Polyangiaceae bacterium]|nr:hypothetical protein [Polyangiaceae bacterium]
MKIELQILFRDEHNVDAYLVSGSHTPFSWSESSASGDEAFPPIAGSTFIKKTPKGKKNAIYIQQIQGNALTSDAILAELQHAILDGRQIAHDAMSNLSIEGDQWQQIKHNDLDQAIDRERLAALLGQCLTEVGASEEELAVVSPDSPQVRLFAHMLYRTAYGLSTDTILVKPYVQQHGHLPAMGRRLGKKGDAWLGETGARDLDGKGQSWAEISNLNDGGVAGLLKAFSFETRWRERHNLKHDQEQSASNIVQRENPRPAETEKLNPELDRFGASVVHINLDHYGKVLAGTAKLQGDKDKPREESLLWTYMHEMSHSYAATPDGIYLRVNDSGEICFDKTGFPHSTPAERMFAADFMTYFLMRASNDLKNNRYAESGLQSASVAAASVDTSPKAEESTSVVASSSAQSGLTKPALGWRQGVNGGRASAKGHAAPRGRSARFK